MLKRFLAIISFLSVLGLIFGCSDRGTNVLEPDYVVHNGFQSAYTVRHLFSEQLGLSMFRMVKLSPLLSVHVYVPFPDDSIYGAVGGSNFPVLYLLAPFGGDQLYYFNRGLAAVTDRMIKEGEIKPMVIVCVEGAHGYGGTFYGNTWAGGKYAKVIGSIEGDWISGSLIDYIDANFDTDETRAGRAIGGFGMGGYGALRIATEYSENFSAVSAVSAPLDFDGSDGSGGFVPLFKQLINEYSAEVGGPAADYVTYTQYKNIDTSYSNELRTILLAAACAFSPYVDYDTLYLNPAWDPPAYAGDTFYFPDTTTKINPEQDIYFLLPFDSAGDIYSAVWSLWLDNNIESILADHPDALDTTAIKLFTIGQDNYGFSQQTIDFADYLETYLTGHGVSVNLDPLNFDGYPGYPAAEGQMIYDILPAILKFHSDNFDFDWP
jgi:hypothetical protein